MGGGGTAPLAPLATPMHGPASWLATALVLSKPFIKHAPFDRWIIKQLSEHSGQCNAVLAYSPDQLKAIQQCLKKAGRQLIDNYLESETRTLIKGLRIKRKFRGKTIRKKRQKHNYM